MSDWERCLQRLFEADLGDRETLWRLAGETRDALLDARNKSLTPLIDICGDLCLAIAAGKDSYKLSFLIKKLKNFEKKT